MGDSTTAGGNDGSLGVMFRLLAGGCSARDAARAGSFLFSTMVARRVDDGDGLGGSPQSYQSHYNRNMLRLLQANNDRGVPGL